MRVDSNTVVVLGLSSSDVSPTTLLFLEVETGGIWEKQPSEKHAGKTKPRDYVEFRLVVNVGIQHRGQESTGFADTSREAMSRRSHRSRENLSCHKKCYRIWSKLFQMRLA